MKATPPKLPLRLFRWFCHPDLLPYIEGDLIELFEERVREKGVRKAKWLFVWDVVRLFRPGIVKAFGGDYRMNSLGMFNSFLKTGWRNLVKYKVNSVINILGLTVGIGATILLLLIIDYERSFDSFHKDFEHIYRLADRHPNGNYSNNIVTPLLPALQAEYPEIVAGTRFLQWDDIFIAGEQARSLSFRIVDSACFSVFSFELIHGFEAEALAGPGKVVLTESSAYSLFGSENPMGRTVKLKDLDNDLTVSGVVKDPPGNSSLQFDALVSWPSSPSPLDPDQAGNWYNTFMEAYVKLSPQASPAELEEKSAEFTKKYYIENRKRDKVAFLPFSEQHARQTENDRTVKILAIIAISILIISAVNFVNLSVSQSMGRLKEIGVRKIMGSFRSQLIVQFLVEGLIVIGLALVLGLLLVLLLVPYVNEQFGFGININLYENGWAILSITGICLLIGSLSCLIVSALISRIRVIKSLKENVRWSGAGQWLQKGLLIFQFSVSLLFLAGTFLVWGQIDYMKSRRLGFDGSAVVSINAHEANFQNPEKALAELKRLRNDLPSSESSIEAVSLAQSSPSKYWENYNSFKAVDSVDSKEISLRQITVDHSYLDVLEIPFIHGRNFDPDIDDKAIVLNESAFKKFGWTDLDNKFLIPGGGDPPFRVVGVVKDYHYRSLRKSIQPVVHYYSQETTNQMLVKLHPERIEDGLKALEEVWSTLDSYLPFEYSFIDDEFDKQYKSQEQLGMTATLFSAIAVILAMMGLFSITSFIVNRRRKELGVRKVLGASATKLVALLSRQFVFLVALAFVIASPFIYWLGQEFLADFKYRMELSPKVFLVSGGIVMALTVVVVGLLSGVAAARNPVHSLRDE